MGMLALQQLRVFFIRDSQNHKRSATMEEFKSMASNRMHNSVNASSKPMGWHTFEIRLDCHIVFL